MKNKENYEDAPKEIQNELPPRNKVKDFIASGFDGNVSKGVEMGINSILIKTVARRLPGPLGFVAPIIVEKLIMKYAVPEGRDALIKGLKWVKRVTDEKVQSERTEIVLR